MNSRAFLAGCLLFDFNEATCAETPLPSALPHLQTAEAETPQTKLAIARNPVNSTLVYVPEGFGNSSKSEASKISRRRNGKSLRWLKRP